MPKIVGKIAVTDCIKALYTKQIETGFNLLFLLHEIGQKKACLTCKSTDVIKWGKQNNKQRYKCKSCGLLFIRQHAGVRDKNRFVWFEDWIVGRQTIEQISKESGYPRRTLIRYFHAYLSKQPVFSVYPSERVNLLIDGTYFNNDLCLVLYRDNTIKFTQLYRLTNGEWYEELKEDLENLLKLGVHIESITCDGHKALLKAIRKVCKHATLQRCLVHIQRMCKIWLTARPQSQAGIELRRICAKLHLIKNSQERDYWIVSLIRWHEQHKDFINEKSFNADSSRYWYKHKMVRRCFMVIKKALPDMFRYIDNPRIPKTTNGLESFFGHLKGNLNIHRGLSPAHRKEFILSYLFLKNKQISDRFS